MRERGILMDEKRLNALRHQVILAERERLTIDGVLNVESFDDREISLETDLGGLIIQGEDLHIKELNLEKANLLVTGFIKSLEYTGESLSKRGKGLLERLFR
jgi:sporulation protein YabP